MPRRTIARISMRGARYALLSVIVYIITTGCTARPTDAHWLIQQVYDRVGGRAALLERGDVRYEYTYRRDACVIADASDGCKNWKTVDSADAPADVSVEQYIFNGELSRGRYIQRAYLLADRAGDLIQGYDGERTWLTLDGVSIGERAALKRADFLRKTNYYWFAMLHKLRDPGTVYTYEGTRTVNGIEYALVRLDFETGIGDVQDTYVLYINPDSRLIDQFTFTIRDYNVQTPRLMQVQYENVDGIPLPVRRRFIASDSSGAVRGDSWTEEIMAEIQFRNGFARTLFTAP